MTLTRGQDMPQEGLRARKRRETQQRITQAGIGLFIQKGYEATTLDEIAAAAGISRRSFFHHFTSKDEILLSLQASVGDMIVAALRAAPPDLAPIDAARAAMVQVCAQLPADDMIVIDRLMRSNAAVQARKQASYVQQETALFAALRDRWPAPDRETGLRLIATLAIGAMRLAVDRFSQEAGRRSLATLLDEAFDAVKTEMRA